ncbi:MAG TPA: peroxiredoxin [Candidatus Binataceae bacterium]|jgi:peroxiredoxin Q/BCP|nr:peroxiredoxin [Candidatus Binataceae bacterium]
MPPHDGLDVGDSAPDDLVLRDQRGGPVRLGDFRGCHVVLYFYPADDTPGCTVEGKEFRDLHEQFEALDCTVIGVSVDSVESHRKFADKHALPFPLLSDSDGTLARTFGVLRDGAADRSTFVLDRDLRIRRRWDQVKPRGHAQQVLEFVRALLESHRMLGG